MQSEEKTKRQEKRKQLYRKVVKAFEHKYSWLGRLAAREMLISAASANLEQHSNPPIRYRTHLMLAWKRGWLKSSLLTRMANILGDELCSVMGKVTDAGMRGSVSSGQFTPPKPLKTPIVISTEFGQTNFEDELLNMFLSLLEEGYTNVTMNKLGQLPDSAKRDIEKRYNGQIEFGEKNEFNLNTNFVFWGATYDPSKLQDDALRSRINIVTPPKPLDGSLTRAIDEKRFQLSQDVIRDVRRELKAAEEYETNFNPPPYIYKEYGINPRESRDLQAYMAARNWWGLKVNPDIMEGYIETLQESRRQSRMDPEELVLDLIFDNPMTYDEIQEKTGFSEVQVYKIINDIGARPAATSGDETEWVVYSGDGSKEKEDDDNDDSGSLDGFLEGLEE